MTEKSKDFAHVQAWFDGTDQAALEPGRKDEVFEVTATVRKSKSCQSNCLVVSLCMFFLCVCFCFAKNNFLLSFFK